MKNYNPSEIEPKWPHYAKATRGKQNNSYNPQVIEKEWQTIWEKTGLNKTDLKAAKKPFYNLMMYPYPSAEGLHVGNVYAFTGADIYGRLKKMQGWDVFEPIGFDSGGIHSENYAIKVGVHPKIQVPKNIAHFSKQLHQIGCMYDWNHTVDVMDPNYYKWTQWIFVQLFKAGLAYKKKAPVTWCPSCKTTLSDEQTEKKRKTKNEKLKTELEEYILVCERCKTPVEKKNLNQWFFKITDYAERLLKNTEKLDWTEKVLIAQRNWIGKSEGVEITFKLKTHPPAGGSKLKATTKNSKLKKSQNVEIKVFTTRPDTLFGCTFFCLAPEHPLVDKITSKEYKKAVSSYKAQALAKSEQQRKIDDKSKNGPANGGAQRAKSGVFTGAYVINPANNEKIPVWVADYILMVYGGGAVMGVPGHDKRDWDFAKKYGLAIKRVVKPYFRHPDPDLASGEGSSDPDVRSGERKDASLDSSSRRNVGIQNDKNEVCYESSGVLVKSGPWNGWRYPEDLDKVVDWLEKRKIGKKATTYKLRDWCISRQRYWGPPIPMIYCKHCAAEGKSWYDTKEAEVFRSEKCEMGSEIKEVGSGNDESGESKYQNITLRAAGIASGDARQKSKKSHFSLHTSNMPGWYPLPEDQLPVLLPYTDDYLPGEAGGKAPLARLPEFYKVKCPHCGSEAQRETDVSDTFLDSSWYFLRYPSISKRDQPSSSGGLIPDQLPFDPEITKKWLPVTQYTGGAEHSVLHLLYSRFITMALHDLGYLDFEEPFPHFYAHGLIIKDGAKMSKSRGNIVNPDEYIEKFGADALRMYLMFVGPFNMGGDFRDTGMIGMYKFLGRVWRLVHRSDKGSTLLGRVDPLSSGGFLSKEEAYWVNKTVKKVGEDIAKFKYNTAIAAIMEYVNFLAESAESAESAPSVKAIKSLILVLAPFVPHLAEELWFNMNPKTLKLSLASPSACRGRANSKTLINSIHSQPWPSFDPKLCKESQIVIVIQVNGRVRDKLTIDNETMKQWSNEAVRQLALQSQKIQKYLKAKKVKKTIFVSGKLVNFVV